MRKENLWYPPATPFVRLAKSGIYGAWKPRTDIHDNDLQSAWMEYIRRTGDTQEIERAARCLRHGWSSRCQLTGCPKCRLTRLMDSLKHINISEYQKCRTISLFIPVVTDFPTLFRNLEHFRRLIRQKSRRERLKYEFRVSGYQEGYRAKWYENLVFSEGTSEDTLDGLVNWANTVHKFGHIRIHKWSGTAIAVFSKSLGKVTTMYNSYTCVETFKVVLGSRLWSV